MDTPQTKKLRFKGHVVVNVRFTNRLPSRSFSMLVEIILAAVHLIPDVDYLIPEVNSLVGFSLRVHCF